MTGYGSRNKIGVRGILISRKDGSARGPYDVVLGTWEEADAILKLWAKSSAGNGCFETCDFRVVFEDGNSYSGTYYLRQQDAFLRNLLSRHIRKVCEETRIAWEADAFLEKYAIPVAA
ncbi:MAG: hypothetical protein EG824_09735 [Deltaproteobacteria bacterium]|nr:hypothetical protein [Deltaproteobacteria bacterium]